jgi:hypothetical protein
MFKPETRRDPDPKTRNPKKFPNPPGRVSNPERVGLTRPNPTGIPNPLNPSLNQSPSLSRGLGRSLDPAFWRHS